MTASFQGALARTDRGCLFLGNGPDAEILVFPYGSHLSADGQSVDVPGRGVFQVGGTVSGGGGNGGANVIPNLPEECRSLTDAFLWQ